MPTAALALAALVLAAAPSLPAAGAPAAPAAAQPPAAAARAEVHALVERCVAAYGGKKAVVRLARVREEGTVTSLLHPGQPGRITRVYQRSGKLRVEIAFPGAPVEVRVLDGGRGWRFGEEVGGPFLMSMILQAARLDLPALLAAWENKVEDRGAWEADGATLRVLALEVAPGVVVEAGIDPATGRILRSRGASRGGAPVEFVTTYSDFRTVDGVLVAFREGNWANGQTTGETVLEKVELPARIDPAAFRP
ncbi:hypothetical protein [Anaeromyxobacter dehalogenans]|uniref:Outer membrane lipoprotein-sorting protein n=1 Tax=Anaeromyxobacter dehalogenans (strain 2CP-C) TaxID=290397 RepID=Q2IF13_ANADE|nr:hypothetical protein [Anaeromyxobacter dehalogenans]ABC83173.1 hypothetical protein Adeh_3406 [Anaeromyxobacter dehalogenans 2CP-C]